MNDLRPEAGPTPSRPRDDEPRLLTPKLLQPGERVRLELKPAAAVILIRCYRTVFWAAMLVLVNEAVRPDRWLAPEVRLVVAAVAVGGALVKITIATLDWIGRIYVMTDRRIIRQRGILHVSVFECPLDRVQNTFLDFRWEERLLGLGSIVFMTAGSGQVEAVWASVSHPLEVHREVAGAIEAARAGGGGAATV